VDRSTRKIPPETYYKFRSNYNGRSPEPRGKEKKNRTKAHARKEKDPLFRPRNLKRAVTGSLYRTMY